MASIANRLVPDEQETAVLAGLVKCTRCGASYQLETSSKKANGEYFVYRYYNCKAFCRTGREACAGHRIPVDKLDQAVLQHVADHLYSVERCRQVLQQLVDETGALKRKTEQQRQYLRQELDAVERKVQRYRAEYEAGKLDAAVLNECIKDLLPRREELQETLDKVVPLRLPPAHLFTEQNLLRFQADLKRLFLGDDRAMAKNHLQLLVEAVLVDGDEITIVGKSDEVLRLMVAGEGPDFTTGGPSPTTVTG